MWFTCAIFLARLLDVALATVRIICVGRGHRAVAMSIGFVETFVWVFAIGAVLAHLDRWHNIVALAAGHSAGLGLGMWIEKRLALGHQVITFISRGPDQAVADRLRAARRAVSAWIGQGRDGPISVCLSVSPRRDTAALLALARAADPQVVITVGDVAGKPALHAIPAGTQSGACGEALVRTRF